MPTLQIVILIIFFFNLNNKQIIIDKNLKEIEINQKKLSDEYLEKMSYENIRNVPKVIILPKKWHIFQNFTKKAFLR